MSEFTIRIVDDEACPGCGQVGRPKVGHADGTWGWKCSTSDCEVAYYTPETGAIEKRLPEDEYAAMCARVKAEVEEQMRGKVWICRSIRAGISESRMIPEGDPIPEGYHALGTPECQAHGG